MKIISSRNVNVALYKGLKYLARHGIFADSRNGRVLKSKCPVTTIYSHPQERVLCNLTRKANPFFHFLESLWMIAGDNKIDFPSYYAKQISSYSDDGITLNGAYGYRWRNYFKYDQLEFIINELKKDTSTRRCVLAMYDGYEDLYRSVSDTPSKDIPCNTHVYFSVLKDTLNMTVCNRSNDMVWGAYGANAVHFSVLLEYIACRTNLKVGTYYQISNDFHMYVERQDVKRLLDNNYKILIPPPNNDLNYLYNNRKYRKVFKLFNNNENIDSELSSFFTKWRSGEWFNERVVLNAINNKEFTQPAIVGIAIPMVYSYHAYKGGNKELAINFASNYIKALDWRVSCYKWYL